jgi:hypothetical protein
MFKSISKFFKTLIFGPSELIDAPTIPLIMAEETQPSLERSESNTPKAIEYQAEPQSEVPTADYLVEKAAIKVQPVTKSTSTAEEVPTMKPKTRKSKGHNYRKGPRGPRKSTDTNKK